MPKIEIDYSNTIIYKITCKDSNIKDVYVGHTTNFVQRKHAHKQSCINEKSTNYNCKLYQVIRNNGGWNNWTMEIVTFFNCNDHYEARKKEQEYFETLHATLNSIEPMPKPKLKQEIIQNKKIINGCYNCVICHYHTSRKSQYERHITTVKHQNNENASKMLVQASKKVQKTFICNNCGNEYKHDSSYYKHKKKCEIKQPENITMNVEEEPPVENNQYSTDLIMELLKQNQEFKELILEQNKQMLEMSKDRNVTNNNNITQNNNKFNLNVFLNETCKDALNLSDFLESLILTLTDFENFGPLGYCGGISNILVKGLNKLDISKRPIHCSDLKREVIHVKNNNTWHKDDDKEQMIKAIKAIEHKNVKQMSLWAKANPEYKDPNHKKSDLYTKLIDQSLCDTDKEKAMKNYNKIIRTIAKEILVDKDK
jgi:hypothetical protein